MKYLGKIQDDKDLVTKEYVDGKSGVTGVKGNSESSYRTGNVNLTAANVGAVSNSEKGAANGIASLDSTGKVPSSQLPSSQTGLTIDDIFPVGSIYVMPTNTNPNTIFSGTTWTLEDKEFKHQFITTGVVSRNTTNVTSIDSQVFELEGHHIWARVFITNKVVLNDDAKPLFTIDVDKIGINSSYSNFIYGWTDQGNGIVLANLPNSESGSDVTVESRDVVTRGTATTYVAASSTIYFSFDIHTGTTGMLDSFCDKFYWKRTA